MSDNTSPQQKLWDLVKDMRFGMLTHRHADGELHAHPLTTQNKDLDEGSVLYFFISRKTELGQRLQQDGNVNVAYADPGKDCYVSISGQARLLEDQAKIEELFNTFAKAWFPGGPTDPDLALLAVDIAHAEYWDVKQSKIGQVITMAKAAVTGKPPHGMSEHKELNFQ